MQEQPKLARWLQALDISQVAISASLDEEGTLKRLRKLRRELINPAVPP